MKSILGAIFSKQSTLGVICFQSKDVGRHFCSYVQGVCLDFQGFYEGFHRFCPDFSGFCRIFRDFARIFTKSKLLGVRLHSLHPSLLHHCTSASQVLYAPTY